MCIVVCVANCVQTMSIEAAACELGSVGAAVDNCTHSKLLIPGVSKHHPHSSIKGKLLLPFEAPRGVPVLRCSISAMLYTYKRQGQPISSGRKPFIEDQYILKLTTSPYIRLRQFLKLLMDLKIMAISIRGG